MAFLDELLQTLAPYIPVILIGFALPSWIATLSIPLISLLVKYFNPSKIFKVLGASVILRSYDTQPEANHYYCAMIRYLQGIELETVEVAQAGTVTKTFQIETMKEQPFTYKGETYYISAKTQEGRNGGYMHRELTISGPDRSKLRAMLNELVEEYQSQISKGAIAKYHYNDVSQWVDAPVYVSKNFSNLYLHPEVQQELIHEVDSFIASEKFYKERGLAYRRGFLFHGAPGCGKSSVINAIANRAKYEVVSLHISPHMSGNELRRLCAHVSPKSVVVFEDADGYKFTNKRIKATATYEMVVALENYDGEINTPFTRRYYDLVDDACERQEYIRALESALEQHPEGKHDLDRVLAKLETKLTDPYKIEEVQSSPNLSISDFLGVLDGTNYFHSCFIVMTTNHPSKLDPALIRPGRMDRHFEFKPANVEIIERAFADYFPGQPLPSLYPDSTITQAALINMVIVPNREHYLRALEVLDREVKRNELNGKGTRSRHED